MIQARLIDVGSRRDCGSGDWYIWTFTYPHRQILQVPGIQVEHWTYSSYPSLSRLIRHFNFIATVAPRWHTWLEVEVTLRHTVRYYVLSECCCLKVAVLFQWGILSDERTGLQFAVQSLSGPCRAEYVTILYCLIWDSPNLDGRTTQKTSLPLLPFFRCSRNMFVYRAVASQWLLYSSLFRGRCLATGLHARN
jgi:hypothetical protein